MARSLQTVSKFFTNQIFQEKISIKIMMLHDGTFLAIDFRRSQSQHNWLHASKASFVNSQEKAKPMRGSKLFRKFVQTAFVGAAIAMAQSASAVVVTQTIDFNNLPVGTLGNTNRAVGSTGGFLYNGGVQGDSQLAISLPGIGNTVLVDGNEGNSSGAGGSLSRTGSALFSVLSFDIANLYGPISGGAPVQVSGGGLNGSGFRVGIDPGNFAWTATTFSLQTIDLTAFGTQFENLTSFVTNIVSFGANHYMIDNIVVQFDNGVSADVPEPGSIALLGLALAGLGVTRRKKAS